MLLLLLVVAGCSDDSVEPKPDPPTSEGSAESIPTGSASEVRESLSRLDPCGLIEPLVSDSSDRRVQGDPNRCTVPAGAGYLAVVVGVPFDEADRAKADNPANRLEALDVEGLRAYKTSFSDSQSCYITFAVGAHHGIAIESDDHCSTAEDAATVVATQLQSEDPPLRPRSDPQNHTACGLLGSAYEGGVEPTEAPGGLSSCSSESDSTVEGIELNITYMDIDLDAFSAEDGERTRVAGRDVFLKTEPADCVAYTILGKTSAKHAAGPNVQLSMGGETCDSVTSLLPDVTKAWAAAPPDSGDFSQYLVRIR
ncbi:hypothetical protein WBG06_04610 [Nocardioides sp. CCNWLW239]|uniref:hypothetical protein n=1 Tax=Nocardioides sp. CCNWLW239 TaxID=3128902 RepID=UPI0030175951